VAIRAAVQCVFRDGDRLLGFEIHDSTKDVVGFRSLGGGIEDGETSRQAVEREVAEELGVPITDPVLLGVLENIFVFEGRPGHEIVFVYESTFLDAANYRRESFAICEPNFETYPAIWKTLEDFRSGRLALYPPDLLELLERTPVPVTA
jgi:8-oxo-dGTP pyrophosphatase MutT (NUDIX family)